MEITVGLKGTVKEIVNENITAEKVGSGSLPVFATPMMVALMEKAACKALENSLDEGSTTVGTKVDVEHVAATPVGMEVRAEAEITAVEKNILTYTVTAYDAAGKIGEGTHKRAIVTSQKFLDKVYSKL